MRLCPKTKKGVDKMMRTVGLAALGTGFIFLMTVLGSATVFLVSRRTGERAQRVLFGFAAGVMTAAAVWSLLLPSIARATELGLISWLPGVVGILCGVGFLALLDALLAWLRRRRKTEEISRSGVMLVTAITLHNVPEGMAVGLAFALAATGEGLAAASALALGIGIQNFPEGAAVSLPQLQCGRSRGRAFAGGVCSGAVEPLAGILAAVAVSAMQALMPWLLAFAAGAMLYVVVEELVPQAHSREGTCGYVAGFLAMMVLDVALG